MHIINATLSDLLEQPDYAGLEYEGKDVWDQSPTYAMASLASLTERPITTVWNVRSLVQVYRRLQKQSL